MSLAKQALKLINESNKLLKRSKININEDTVEFNVKNAEKNLSELVSKLIDFKVNLKVEVIQNKRDYLLKVSSNDISNGMKPKMFKSLIVSNFGGGIKDDPKHWWVPINYKYEHFDGGNNGSDIVTVWLDMNGDIIEKRTKF